MRRFRETRRRILARRRLLALALLPSVAILTTIDAAPASGQA